MRGSPSKGRGIGVHLTKTWNRLGIGLALPIPSSLSFLRGNGGGLGTEAWPALQTLGLFTFQVSGVRRAMIEAIAFLVVWWLWDDEEEGQ
jgi:hypothetical protein